MSKSNTAAELEKQFKDHAMFVSAFLSEMYAAMIDPLEDHEVKVSETCQLLLDRAGDYMEQAAKIEELQQDQQRLVGALQRLVTACPRGCFDGKIGNAGSGYMECPACGPLRRALSSPSAQQAAERIAAQDGLLSAVAECPEHLVFHTILAAAQRVREAQ